MPLVRFIAVTWPGRLAAGAVVVALVGGVLIAPRLSSGAGEVPLRTQAAARANVTQTVAVAGTVNASQVRAAFRVSGRLTEVLVKVGDAVAAGQPLARIDPADLSTAVKQAEASLLSAQAKYDATVLGASAEDLALARNAYESAQLGYEQARRSAENDVASARAAFERFKTSYDSAKAAFASLAAALGGDLRAYARAIADLRTATLGIRGTLQETLRPGDVSTAHGAAMQAEQSLVAAEGYVSAVLLPAVDAYAQSAGLIAAAIGLLDRGIAEGWETASLSATYSAAQIELATATTRLTGALDGASAHVGAAQSSLTSARAALNTMASRSDPGLDAVRTQLDALLLSIAQEQQLGTAARAKTSQATTALAPVAEAVGGGYSSLLKAIATAEEKSISTLGSQELALRNAQVSFQRSTATPKSSDIALAQATLQLAQIALDKARTDLANATLTAPDAGVVASVTGQVGETPGNPFAVIAITRTLTLRGSVGESEIARLRAGQVAAIQVDAVGTATRMTGRVSALEPVATIQQGVPVYGVDIDIDIADAAVRPGMSGSATIIVASRQSVVTVPNSAIRTSGGARVVQVMRGGTVEDVRPTFGIASDTVTEVTAGIEEGDVIVLPQPRTTTTAGGGQRTITNLGGGGIAVPPGAFR